jgi:hypothetical protein
MCPPKTEKDPPAVESPLAGAPVSSPKGLIAFMALGMWYASQPLSALRGDEELMTMGVTFLFGLGRFLVEGAARDSDGGGRLRLSHAHRAQNA